MPKKILHLTLYIDDKNFYHWSSLNWEYDENLASHICTDNKNKIFDFLKSEIDFTKRYINWKI